MRNAFLSNHTLCLARSLFTLSHSVYILVQSGVRPCRARREYSEFQHR